MTGPVVEVRDVTARYGTVTALTRVTATISPGRVTGLIGMNGSGKSTLFKTIIGLLRPAAGEVTIGGAPPGAARKNGMVSYVPQSEDVDWSFPLSVREVVMMGRYGHQGFARRPRRRDRAAVAEALERVELTGLAGRQIGQLSGGQKKRVFVARGLAQHASVMLLDEPFAGVDNRSEKTISGVLRQLADQGRTVLVSTHDLHTLPHLADDAILLLRTVLFHGPVREALEPGRLVQAFGMTMPPGTER